MKPKREINDREFREHLISFAETVPRSIQDLLFDPPTSGGFLIGVTLIALA